MPVAILSRYPLHAVICNKSRSATHAASTTLAAQSAPAHTARQRVDEHMWRHLHNPSQLSNSRHQSSRQVIESVRRITSKQNLSGGNGKRAAVHCYHRPVEPDAAKAILVIQSTVLPHRLMQRGHDLRAFQASFARPLCEGLFCLL